MYFSPLSKLNEHPLHHPAQVVQLSEKGLGYSLHYKLTQWTEHSALAAKPVSAFPNLNGQECLWFTAARNIKLLMNKNRHKE